jgi:hypothetical protein
MLLSAIIMMVMALFPDIKVKEEEKLKGWWRICKLARQFCQPGTTVNILHGKRYTYSR